MKLKAKAYLRIAAEDWRDKYDWVGSFFEGLAEVRLDGQHGFVNEQGNEVVPLKYNNAGNFHEGLGPVLKDKWGFVDQQGEEVIPLKYDEVWFFREGFAEVKLNGQWGYLDIMGKEVIPCVYDKEDLPERKDVPTLSLQIRRKYEQDPEGLEFIRPEFDWKAWYQQVTK